MLFVKTNLKNAYFEDLLKDSLEEKHRNIYKNICDSSNNLILDQKRKKTIKNKVNSSEKKHRKKKSHSFESKNKYLEILKYIRTQNDYQTIPSIFETFNKKLFLPQFEENEVSPVSYQNLLDLNKNPHNIIAFKSKLRRFAENKSPTDRNLGPGSYDVYFRKPLSSRNIRVKGKNSFISEIKQDGSPGPGSYLNEHNITSFPRKQTPNKFQFFQSGIERFIKLQKKEKLVPSEIGVNLLQDTKPMNKHEIFHLPRSPDFPKKNNTKYFFKIDKNFQANGIDIKKKLLTNKNKAKNNETENEESGFTYRKR